MKRLLNLFLAPLGLEVIDPGERVACIRASDPFLNNWHRPRVYRETPAYLIPRIP